MSNLKDAGANLINSIADNAEIVKDVYDEGLKPTVQQAGKILSFPLELINSLLVRPRIWITNANYKLQETNILIAKKLENISADEIKAPEDYIAVPALQALSYSMDSKELRNMYANLLAKSMYTKTADEVHPAYVDIIRQLTPIDVNVLEYIVSNENGIAFKKVIIHNVLKDLFTPTIEIVTAIQFASPQIVSNSINNLSRLGLIEIGGELFDKKRYEDIDNNPLSQKFYKNTTSYIKDPDNEKLNFENKSMVITTLGKMFYKICNEDIK